MQGAEIAYAQLTRRGQIRRMRHVATRALTLYGIEPVSLSLLGHMYNTTFAVMGPHGARYVLHVLRPEEELSESRGRARVESELWWLDRVRADLPLSVPVAVRTHNGEGVVGIALESMAAPRLCTLFHWVDGRFARHRLIPTHLEVVGRLTATLHHHSAGLQVPAWLDRPIVDRADSYANEHMVVYIRTVHGMVAAPAQMPVTEGTVTALSSQRSRGRRSPESSESASR